MKNIQIKEIKQKLNHNLAINSLEGKLDIKFVKVEINKFIKLNHMSIIKDP